MELLNFNVVITEQVQVTTGVLRDLKVSYSFQCGEREELKLGEYKFKYALNDGMVEIILIHPGGKNMNRFFVQLISLESTEATLNLKFGQIKVTKA